MNILENTKCTVIGPMQYANGTHIRNYFVNELSKLKIKVFDHYNNPFIDESLSEDLNTAKLINKYIDDQNWEKLEEFKDIRSHDLSLIDKSDFIIVHYTSSVTTCGTWEEFFTANKMKKPIFFITDDKKKTPAWVYWTISHKYVYEKKEDVVDILNNINQGNIK